jgi:hypothetical protein
VLENDAIPRFEGKNTGQELDVDVQSCLDQPQRNSQLDELIVRLLLEALVAFHLILGRYYLCPHWERCVTLAVNA